MSFKNKNIGEFSFNTENMITIKKDKLDDSYSSNSPVHFRLPTRNNKNKVSLNNINILSFYDKKFPQVNNPIKIKHNEFIPIRKYLLTTENSNLINNKNIFCNLEKLTNNHCKSLFENKYIRECSQKLIFNQVNITDYNLNYISRFGKRNSSFLKNKNSVIIDDSKINNFCNEKNIILNVMETQSQSNFNNKYKIIYKSADSKKRENIQKYFSNIKKTNNLDLPKQNFKNYKLPMDIKNLVLLKKIKRRNTEDTLQKIKYNLKSNKAKKNKLFIPILSRTTTNKPKRINKIIYNNSMYV